MNLAYLLTGVIIAVSGIFILIRRDLLAKVIGILYKQKRKDYNQQYTNTKQILKPLVSLLIKPGTYYDNEDTAKSGLLLIALLLLILGCLLILLGLRIIN